MFNMKKVNWRLVAYLIVFCVIVSFPVRHILAFECPRIPPREYRFRTGFHDPYDPMRGRYIQLDFEASRVSLPASQFAIAGYMEECFAVLDSDSGGNAFVADLCRTRKDVPRGRDFLRVKYRGFHQEADPRARNRSLAVHVIELPFQRFYLNEKLADQEVGLAGMRTAWDGSRMQLKVKVYSNGGFSVDDLLFDGRPVREMLREAAVKEKSK